MGVVVETSVEGLECIDFKHLESHILSELWEFIYYVGYMYMYEYEYDYIIVYV